MRRRVWTRAVAGVGTLALALATLAGSVLAHGGSLGGAARPPLSVPTWLVAGTATAAVGVSALGAGLAVDRASPGTGTRTPLRRFSLPGARLLALVANALGVVGFVGVVVVGYVGPADPLSNGAVVVVWAGWWGGFAMSTYLVGNAWPALDPFRTLARPLAGLVGTERWRFGAWPSVAGLLALVWLEVVAPLADRPPVLATVVLAYGLVTVAGAVVYGADVWFQEVDPVARAFALYGRVAPLGRERDGSLTLRLPGTALTGDVLAGADDVAFVVALLWGTTFDGLVTTPLWGRVARRVVDWGVPAGYHLAHFLDYFLSLVPALVLAVTAPLATVNPDILVVPDWFGGLAVGAVLVGHVLAVLVTRATASDLFSDRTDAVRAQAPFAVLLVWFTALSLWVVTRPEFAPPFLGP
jgi:hypothetical protein